MAGTRALSLLRWRMIPGALLLGAVLVALDNDATPPCLPASEAACAACHTKDLSTRFPAAKSRPCTPYCLSCHFKDSKDQHHSVGLPLRKMPADGRLLTEGDRTGCKTCHDLATQRYDRIRWRSESLFDRVFRSQSRYKTYLLVYRNDRGQLCLACH